MGLRSPAGSGRSRPITERRPPHPSPNWGMTVGLVDGGRGGTGVRSLVRRPREEGTARNEYQCAAKALHQSPAPITGLPRPR
jgi:hypothetical protein